MHRRRGEIGFQRPEGEPYYREVWQFELSNHYVSRHAMTVATGYDGAYVDATYSRMSRPRRDVRANHRISTGQVGQLAGASRGVSRIRARPFPDARASRLLDVGSGLGVFPHAVKRMGW